MAEHETYLGILLSPAHMGAEVTITLVFDLFFGGFARRWINRKLKQRDKQHGHAHKETDV